ncbi:MAG: hypothetical protein R3B93_26145 [Bacteroidia bacterium]
MNTIEFLVETLYFIIIRVIKRTNYEWDKNVSVPGRVKVEAKSILSNDSFDDFFDRGEAKKK